MENSVGTSPGVTSRGDVTEAPTTTTRDRPPNLRVANLALVLQAVLAAREPLSRAGVAVLTGLNRSTVSRLVDELVAGGLLDEGATTATGGRPATPLTAARGTVAGLGMEVNVKGSALRLVDLAGETLAERVEERDFAGSDPATVLRQVGQTAATLANRAGVPVVGAGLALPGLVRAETGDLLRAPNLDWTQVAAARLVRPVLSWPVQVRNEADLAARVVAEDRPGHPSAVDSFLYLSGETGIGGATYLHGRPLNGLHGWAGEFGHVCADPRGPLCRCGSTGCLETYAGRLAIMRAAGLPDSTGAAELIALHAQGNAGVERAVSAAVDALVVVLAGVVNALDVPTVVLGGHLAAVLEISGVALGERIAARVPSARYGGPPIRVIPAPADRVAPAATGAAHLALEPVVREPSAWLRRVGS